MVNLNAENEPFAISKVAATVGGAREKTSNEAREDDASRTEAAEDSPIDSRIKAMIQAARYRGVELDPGEFQHVGPGPGFSRRSGGLGPEQRHVGTSDQGRLAHFSAFKNPFRRTAVFTTGRRLCSRARTRNRK